MFIYKVAKYSDSHVHSIQLDKCSIYIQQNTKRIDQRVFYIPSQDVKLGFHSKNKDDFLGRDIYNWETTEQLGIILQQTHKNVYSHVSTFASAIFTLWNLYTSSNKFYTLWKIWEKLTVGCIFFIFIHLNINIRLYYKKQQ